MKKTISILLFFLIIPFLFADEITDLLDKAKKQYSNNDTEAVIKTIETIKGKLKGNFDFENLNPNLCTFLQKGVGFDFHYMVVDVPDTGYNAVYISKTKDFENIVYLYIYPDPEGIKLANYIDKNQIFLHLSNMIDDTVMKSYKVSWCTKLYYLSN